MLVIVMMQRFFLEGLQNKASKILLAVSLLKGVENDFLNKLRSSISVGEISRLISVLGVNNDMSEEDLRIVVQVYYACAEANELHYEKHQLEVYLNDKFPGVLSAMRSAYPSESSRKHGFYIETDYLRMLLGIER